MPRPDINVSIQALRAADPRLGALIARVGPYLLEPEREGTDFGALARSILHQQLSTGAARTIHGRFLALFEAAGPTPTAVLAMEDASLRAAGLSRPKIAYLKDLAAHAQAGELPLERLASLSDAEIVHALTRVKGIGEWTVQMLLMFRLGRADVLPTADLGIQKAIQRLDGLESLPGPKAVRDRGEIWRPHATMACWYLWRSLELPDEPISTQKE